MFRKMKSAGVHDLGRPQAIEKVDVPDVTAPRQGLAAPSGAGGRSRSALWTAAALVALVTVAAAQEHAPLPERPEPAVAPPSRLGTVRLELDNDLFAGKDDGYSNGFGLSYSTRAAGDWSELVGEFLAPALRWIPLVGDADDRKRLTFSLSHLITTPEETDATELVEDDVPYSGMVLVGMSLSGQTEWEFDALSLVLGWVGPSASGERVQNGVHQALGGDASDGWDHQLEDEFVFALTFTHRNKLVRLRSADDLGLDVGLFGAGSLGNLATNLGAGLEVRAGWRMPDGFEVTQLGRRVAWESYLRDGSEHPFTVHLFGSISGVYTEEFLTIEGNTWKDSHGLEVEPWSAVLTGGITVSIHSLRIYMSWTTGSAGVKGESDFSQTYGGLVVAYAF